MPCYATSGFGVPGEQGDLSNVLEVNELHSDLTDGH
jgi:hypothetical protein